MDAILAAHNTLEHKANLSKTLTDVQALIDQLQTTRDAVESSPELTAMHMAKLKNPVKQSFDRIEDDLKEVNKGLNQYQKALTNKWKNSQLPTAVNESISAQPELVDRAIAMHLLREGMFGVADTFVREVTDCEGQAGRKGLEESNGSMGDGMDMSDAPSDSASIKTWARDFADDADIMRDHSSGTGADAHEKGRLQKKFAQMYHILDSLRNQHDLGPAIAWSKEYSAPLEARGSNLEFQLAELKFVELYRSTDQDAMTDDEHLTGLLRALDYARTTFPAFSTRYARPSACLSGSLAFATDLQQSPYKTLFYNTATWDDVATAFTLDFCSLLGLSPSSPLRTAVTAGGIALPTLSKVERIMTQSRGQWTSVNELPVETPLPPGYLFHSVFVCPVSKEQATDANPPMMLPCGHVIARESLEMHSRGKSRMKCPYCPNESAPREAKRVYI